MSNDINTGLAERAWECMEQLTSHPSGIDKRIQAAVDANDLQDLEYQVSQAEALLSQEHFNNFDILGEPNDQTDIY